MDISSSAQGNVFDEIHGTAEFEYRPFISLFGDAVYYTDLARPETGPSGILATHARIAVLLTVFSVEGAINSALHNIGLSSRLFKRIERLPFPEKIEFIAREATEPKVSDFDQDIPEIADMLELIELRNEQAHPKNRKRKVSRAPGESDPHGKPAFKDVELQYSPRLKIVRASSAWTHQTAVSALRVADAFLDKYFVDLCRLKKKRLDEIFLCRFTGEGWSSTVYEQDSANRVLATKAAHGLRLSYLQFKSR